MKDFIRSDHNPLRGYLKCQRELLPYNVLLAIYSIIHLST